MKYSIAVLVILALSLMGCEEINTNQETKDAESVQNQQQQYAIGQPIPKFDWSLERHLLIQLYEIRNQKAATHSVWRSDYGMVEGDCPSMGFGMPYDTSLTNPVTPYGSTRIDRSLTTIGQAEPNGIFASTNTSATWVMCVGDAGVIEPVYVESKVTVFPGPVLVDYDTNRVTRTGASTVRISGDK